MIALHNAWEWGIWARKMRLMLLSVACIITMFFIGLQPSLAAGDAVATGTRVGGDENRTRFVADISKIVSYSVYILPDPYRVVIDLPDVTFDLPPGIGHKVRGLVSQYRYGLVEEGKSRIVIDTHGPVLIEKSFLVEPQPGQPARLVVDIVKTTEKAFVKSYNSEQAKMQKGLAALSAEPPSAEKKIILPNRRGKKTIVLDPGHGGIDPGAISRAGTKEKDVVLSFAAVLRQALLATGKYNVVMTRSDDRFVSLKNRVTVAREKDADLFLAIHADTVRGKDARGVTIYTLSDKASDAEAEALAKRENRADIIGGLDLEAETEEITDILIDLAQRELKNHAMFFSKKAVAQLRPLTLMTGKPLRSAGFMVLKAPDVPSVLLELGFLSSKSDEKLLTSAVWQTKIAKAFATAIDNYFATEVASTAN